HAFGLAAGISSANRSDGVLIREGAATFVETCLLSVQIGDVRDVQLCICAFRSVPWRRVTFVLYPPPSPSALLWPGGLYRSCTFAESGEARRGEAARGVAWRGWRGAAMTAAGKDLQYYERFLFNDEREDVQKKTFAKWINSQLIKSNQSPVVDLFTDLRDGNRLLTLLEVLTGKTYKREKGRMRVHHLNNVNKALQILEQNNVKLVNISNNDIVDGNPKLTLGLVWSIILHWQVHYHLKHLMSDLQQTNLEKALLAWCRRNTKEYAGVDVRNFTTSWSDGLAFNALLHHWRPQLFDFNNIARKHPNARLEHAFRLAQEQLGIERLLDPEDVNTSVPDKKSIMMYVMCLFQSLPHTDLEVSSVDLSLGSETSSLLSPVAEGIGTVPGSRPLSLATNVSVELGSYQAALEEVLTWLLEAEDKLNNTPPVEGNLEAIKEQFYQHEDFLRELAGHQEGVRAVLEEGAHMVSEGGLSQDEEGEVRVQMRLLNSRWEDLRIKATNKQSQIHALLSERQQTQLDGLRRWLTATEDRMSHLAEEEQAGLGGLEGLKRRIEQHRELQQDLQRQQSVVDALKHMIVVVDDSCPENAYSQLEDQLTALGERWAHICQWAKERWSRLQNGHSAWMSLADDLARLQAWLDDRETALKQMEAQPAAEIGEVLGRIGKLQVLRREMEAQQKRITHLQEKASSLDGGGTELLEKLEILQDRWDALDQIMDVQGQRINNSGFDMSWTPLGDDPVSGDQILDGHWERTTTITTVTTNVVSNNQEMVQHSGSKKRRVGSASRQEFQSALQQHQVWLQHAEDTLHKGFTDLTVDEQQILLEEVTAEMQSRKPEKQRVQTLGQQLLDELMAEGESVSEERDLLTEVETKWSALQTLLEDQQRKVSFLKEKHQLAERQTELSNQLERTPPRKYLEAMEALTQWVHGVEGLLLSEHAVVAAIPAMQDQLHKFQVLEGVDEFKSWLCQLETEIPAASSVTSSTELFQLKGKYQVLKDNIDKRTEEFRNLNEMGNDLMLSSESTSVQELARKFTQLNAKWTERRFAEVQAKFERFKSPSNIEPRLNRAIRELHSIEEASCLLELASDDPEGIEGQLKHCLLGSQITDAKTQLDNALELSRSLHSNLPQLSHWLDELDAHLEECDKAESSQDLEAGITYLRDKLLKGETLHKEFTNILHEVKSSLQDAESKIKVLDAVPPNQLSEKHLAECKALQNDMILRKGQLDELRSSVQQIHSLDPSAEMQLADGDKQYNELWARIQALLSSRKEAFAGKKEDKLQGSVKSPVAATRIPIRTVPASNKPITSSVAVATSATMSSFPAKATPQAAPRSSSSILRGTVPPLLEREILEFEQAAQQMLRRMDVMLVTVKGVSDEKDPVKRLELRKHQAQQAEEKLREFNYSVSALEPWLRDARRRLELANNDEGQLQQLQEEFEQKQKEFSELAEQSAELAALNVRHGEASVHDIQTRWQDVHDRFQHFKKEGLDKTKVVPDTKSTMDTNGTQTADFVTRVNKVREAVSTISRQLNSFPLSGRDYDGYQQQEEYLKRVKEGVAALKPSVDDIDRWLKCRDTWVSLHSNCQSFDDWLTNAESMITEWRSCDFPLAEAKIKQKELEKQVTMRTRTMSNMNMACREIISQGLCDHREYVECKLASLKRYTLSLDAIIAWNSVYDREMEVKEVLENYNNLEKECEGARQPVSVELQEKVKKLREDWHYVKSRGEVPITAQESIVTPSIKTVTSPPLRSSPLVTSNISSVKPVSSSPSVHAGERFVEG
ncbi:Dystrophin, partial [Gryllus bimaculatus]